MREPKEPTESPLPSVDRLVEEVTPRLTQEFGRATVVNAAQAILKQARAGWRVAGTLPTLESLLDRTVMLLEDYHSGSLGGAINATGVILHTGLGRAVYTQLGRPAVLPILTQHSNLEIDTKSGLRGSRQAHVSPRLCALTGAEASLVVNNDAGAVLLALAAIARGREVIVSRGELVEIGGGFRIPDVMLESGVILREVGTTNKTRLRDYAYAITPNTAAIMKVHPSNFRMTGFIESAGITELGGLARERGIPLLDDLGSGALVDVGLGEPTVQDRLFQGSDLVMFSGDKLLGGPQAGILVGRRNLIDAMASHPLARALRCDKVTLAMLEHTLLVYQRGLEWKQIPTLVSLAKNSDDLRLTADRLSYMLKDICDLSATVVPTISRVGAGTLPQHELPSYAVAVEHSHYGPSALATAIRTGPYAVFARVDRDTVLLDMRTILGSNELIRIKAAFELISDRNQGD